MDCVKVGVIGVGRMGERHCRVYANMRRARLVGVCDMNEEAGSRIAAQYQVPYYGRLEDLLPEVDAVSLATPTASHFDEALQCLDRRVHVLIEKPLVATLGQARILCQAAEASGLVVQVGHIERFNPAYLELKSVLGDETLLAASFVRLSPFEGSNRDVDVVLDLMIHDVNLALDLIRRQPTKVSAHGLSAFSGTLDHAVAQLSFPNGPLLTMSASRVTEQKIRMIEVTCRDVFVQCDLLSKTLSLHRCTIGEYVNSRRRGGGYRQESVVERITVPAAEPLFLQLQHFIDCILLGRRPLATATDGREALSLAMLIRRRAMANFLNLNQPATVPVSADAYSDVAVAQRQTADY